MIDLPEAVITAVRDPLVVTLAVLLLGGLLTHFLFRRHPLGRAIVRVICLAVLTLVLLYAGVVPYEPLTRTGVPFQDAVHAVLKIAWWLLTAWFLVGFLRVFVITERRPREGKLVQDLLAGLIYLAALLAIIAYVFDLPIQGLLATSGVIAIILGLALQSTLSDVFSGIVLNFSRPYRPGDWISIDGSTDGRVLEMNWRATHVLTAKRDLAIVPNSTIAKAKIVNASSPSGIRPEHAAHPGDTRTGDLGQVDHRRWGRIRDQLLHRRAGPVCSCSERAVRLDFPASGGCRDRSGIDPEPAFWVSRRRRDQNKNRCRTRDRSTHHFCGSDRSGAPDARRENQAQAL
jgi:mechanosensitive ion channel-like protein